MTDDPSARQGPPGNGGTEGPLLGTDPAVSSPASYRMTDWGTLRYAFSVLWHHLGTIILLGFAVGLPRLVARRVVGLVAEPLTEAIRGTSSLVAGFLYAAAVACVAAPFATGYHYAILGISQGEKYPFGRAFAVFGSRRAFFRVLGVCGCFAILFAVGRQLAYTAIPWEYLFGGGDAFEGDLPRWAVNSLYHGVPRALGILLTLPILWAALDVMAREAPVGRALRHSVSLASANCGLTVLMAAALVVMYVLPLFGIVLGFVAATMHSAFYREMVWREGEAKASDGGHGP